MARDNILIFGNEKATNEVLGFILREEFDCECASHRGDEKTVGIIEYYDPRLIMVTSHTFIPLIDRIHKHFGKGKIPIILISGSLSLQESKNFCPDDFITKPVDINIMIETVAKYIPRKAATTLNKSELLTEYAKAWNNLEVSFLEMILANDFVYNSMWVFSDIRGKDNYLAYLRDKFEALKKEPSIALSAEMAFFEYSNNVAEPCLVVEQGSFKSCLFIKSEDGKIKSANLTGIPKPEKANLLGIFPR